MHVVLQIEPMYDSLLYVEFVVVFLVFMLIIVQLFDDVLFAPMTTTLMSLVAITMIVDVTLFEFVPIVVALMQLVAIVVTIYFM